MPDASRNQSAPVNEPAYRHAWRGVSAPCSLSLDGPNGGIVEGYVAVAPDQKGGEVALSVWTDENGWGRRHVAIWMGPGGSRNLADALRELADEIDNG